MELKDLDLPSGILFFWGGHVLLTTYVWSITSEEPEKYIVISNYRWILKIPDQNMHRCLLSFCKEPDQHVFWSRSICFDTITIKLFQWRGGVLWANSRLGSLKILLHALKLFCFLVFGFSAPALALFTFAKPYCWELANWLLRPRHTIALTGVFGSLFQRLLRPWNKESRSEKEAGTTRSKVPGAFPAWPSRSFQRVLVGPAGIPWRIGCKACRSAGLSGKFASYGVSAVGGLQAVNFKKRGDRPRHQAAVQKLLLPDE